MSRTLCKPRRRSGEGKEVRGDGSVPVRDGLRGRARGACRSGGRASAPDDRTPTGQVRIPLASRIWRQGGPSKCALALELLRYARNRLRGKPHCVLCAAWYPSKPVLKRLRDDGWDFVCQVQKHRRFEGNPVRADQRQPYWQAVGKLSGGLKVRVVTY